MTGTAGTIEGYRLGRQVRVRQEARAGAAEAQRAANGEVEADADAAAKAPTPHDFATGWVRREYPPPPPVVAYSDPAGGDVGALSAAAPGEG